MSSVLCLAKADQRSQVIAEQIHRVQMLAYTQEARLLGAIDFPPLRRTVEDIRTCDEEFFVAMVGEELVGAISVWPDPDGTGMNVASLVVAPSFQRRGIGRRLMTEVVQRYGDGALTVQTGARNEPALKLYSQLGFAEIRRWLVGREPLELVKLLRTPPTAASVAQNAS